MQMELQLLSIIRAAKLEHVAYVKLLQFLNSTVSCVSRWCGGIASTRSFPLSDIDMNTHTHTLTFQQHLCERTQVLCYVSIFSTQQPELMNLTKPLLQSFKATHRNAVAIEDGPCEIKSYLLTIDDDQDESITDLLVSNLQEMDIFKYQLYKH